MNCCVYRTELIKPKKDGPTSSFYWSISFHFKGRTIHGNIDYTGKGKLFWCSMNNPWKSRKSEFEFLEGCSAELYKDNGNDMLWIDYEDKNEPPIKFVSQTERQILRKEKKELEREALEKKKEEEKRKEEERKIEGELRSGQVGICHQCGTVRKGYYSWFEAFGHRFCGIACCSNYDPTEEEAEMERREFKAKADKGGRGDKVLPKEGARL